MVHLKEYKIWNSNPSSVTNSVLLRSLHLISPNLFTRKDEKSYPKPQDYFWDWIKIMNGHTSYTAIQFNRIAKEERFGSCVICTWFHGINDFPHCLMSFNLPFLKVTFENFRKIKILMCTLICLILQWTQLWITGKKKQERLNYKDYEIILCLLFTFILPIFSQYLFCVSP